MSKPKKDRKPFFQTKVGSILKGAASIVAPQLVTALEGVSSVGDAIGLINGSGLEPEDKEKLLNVVFEAQKTEEQELTKRHTADAMSDSWLSKNVRPLVLIWCIVIFSGFGILDAVDSVAFTINQDWITTFRSVMNSVIAFYFGGRTLEKGINAYKQLKR